MRALGIVEKVDKSGKISIPTEIRQSLHIKEGEAMEVFTNDDGCVIFSKREPEPSISGRDLRRILKYLDDDDMYTIHELMEYIR